MVDKLKNYLLEFGSLDKLPREKLLYELDRVWDFYKINNRQSLHSQKEKVNLFYSHPVWVLNGLFSEADSDSRIHRLAIARYVNTLQACRIADFGGGSGFLARLISAGSVSQVDIVEAYPFEIFKKQLEGNKKIKYVSSLSNNYDVIIAQDVLEHVDEPLGLALDLISATKKGGILIFANCFYPQIKCHIPSNFYLRHTFIFLMTFAGLKLIHRIDGANHALVFKKARKVRYATLYLMATFLQQVGGAINLIYIAGSRVKNFPYLKP